MAIPQDEPKPEQGQQWVGKHAREHDRFAHVAAKYDGHRATHGCYDVYPYPNGSWNPCGNTPWRTHTRSRRGLSYSALWFAYGAGPGTVSNPSSATLADQLFAGRHGAKHQAVKFLGRP